jgi:mono/diheme cytochrome c family protein
LNLFAASGDQVHPKKKENGMYFGKRRVVAGAMAAAALIAWGPSQGTAQDQVARGKYLAVMGHCTDCHTPGYFFGKPDEKRYLGGSEVGFEIPGLGVFHGPNLTPDKETGLGSWTDEQIRTAFQTGVRPDGRILAPIMPWKAMAQMTKDDAMALVAFLRSIPPVKNKVPGPFGPTQTPTSFVMKIVPPPGAPPKK